MQNGASATRATTSLAPDRSTAITSPAAQSQNQSLSSYQRGDSPMATPVSRTRGSAILLLVLLPVGHRVVQPDELALPPDRLQVHPRGEQAPRQQRSPGPEE